MYYQEQHLQYSQTPEKVSPDVSGCYFFYEVYAFAVRGKLSIIRNNFHAEILALNARTFSLIEVFFLCAPYLGYESSKFSIY